MTRWGPWPAVYHVSLIEFNEIALKQIGLLCRKVSLAVASAPPQRPWPSCSLSRTLQLVRRGRDTPWQPHQHLPSTSTSLLPLPGLHLTATGWTTSWQVVIYCYDWLYEEVWHKCSSGSDRYCCSKKKSSCLLNMDNTIRGAFLNIVYVSSLVEMNFSSATYLSCLQVSRCFRETGDDWELSQAHSTVLLEQSSVLLWNEHFLCISLPNALPGRLISTERNVSHS